MGARPCDACESKSRHVEVGARQCDACEEEISGCDAELNSSRVGWGEQFHADAIRVNSLEMHGGAERCMHTQVLARKH